MALSNNITELSNFIFLLFCTVKLFLPPHQDFNDDCVMDYFQWYHNTVWILAFLVAFVGVIAAFTNRQSLLALYLLGVVVVIVVLLTLLIFGSVVTSKDGSYKVPGRGYKEYKLDGYSHWLRNLVANSDNWWDIIICPAYFEMCSTISQDYPSAEQFFLGDLSPIQSGCCKPPSSCGFKYVKTLWINATNPTADKDCQLWLPESTGVWCYNCDACKAGVLGHLRMEWRKTEVKLIEALVVLMLVFLIGCCAYKNAQNKNAQNKADKSKAGSGSGSTPAVQIKT